MSFSKPLTTLLSLTALVLLWAKLEVKATNRIKMASLFIWLLLVKRYESDDYSSKRKGTAGYYWA